MLYLFLILFIIVVAVVFANIMINKENEQIFNQKQVLLEGLTNKEPSIIFLIGDSVLNNSNYILSEGKSVPDLIKTGHPNTYNFAKDGAVITDCVTQIEQIPAENNTSQTYIFVSAGGNNILNSHFTISKEMIDTFFQQYSTLLYSLKSEFSNAQIYLLTLYYPLDSRFKNLYPFVEQWNTLLSEFVEKNTDFKLIRTNKLMLLKADFTNAVEPSETGGAKIASAILETVPN
jgi:hypothetical protein